jgi:cell division protein FtsZ
MINLAKVDRRKFHNDDPKIKIVGVGGAGSNIIGSLFSKNISAELISINTDWKQLSLKQADRKILIGFEENRGLGCGGDVTKGKQSALENIKEIKDTLLDDTELIIFVGGLGRGTCTGALPVIAKEAKKKGALVMAFLTIPFFMKGVSLEKTQYALEHLENEVDSLILLDNNKLTELHKNISFMNALYVIDKYILNSINALLRLIRENELIQVDFSNLKSVLGSSKLGTIGISQMELAEPTDKLVKECVDNSLLVVQSKNATGALIQVVGDSTLNLRTLDKIANDVKNYISDDANVIISAKFDESMKGKIMLVLMLVGMDYSSINFKKEIISIDSLLKEL